MPDTEVDKPDVQVDNQPTNSGSSLKFNTVDLTDLVAISALSIGFILSIAFNMNELAMSIATGFFGYVGGVASGTSKSNDKRASTPPPPTERKDGVN